MYPEHLKKRTTRAWQGLVLLGAIVLVWSLSSAQEQEVPLLSSQYDHKFIFNPRAEASTEPHAGEALFQGTGRNPGSAAHPNAPGRVRLDAPAQHELATEYGRNDQGELTGSQPAPVPEPDPRFQNVIRLSDDTRSDDFPVIASNPGNREEVWVAWTSYGGRRDEIRLARRDPYAGRWGTWNPVPGVSGDVWRPSLIVTGERVWVIWSQQDLYAANFDLYARWSDGRQWGPLVRLSSNPEGDFDQTATVDAQGRLHLAWQSFREGQSEIFYRRHDVAGWSPEVQVSASPANDWAPSLAVDSRGTAWVAWDTYREGNYDVVVKPVKDGRPGKLQVVAGSGQFEARPSLLVDREDRVWGAYEVGEHGWGKDQGLLVNPKRTPGAMLNLHRQVKVRVMGRPVREAKPEIASLFPARRWKVFVRTDRPHLSHPLLWMNGSGRIHLAVRKLERPENGSEYWRPYLLTMTKGGWSYPVAFPYSVGRSAMYSAGAAAPGSGLWVSWTRDHFPTFRSAVIPPPETMIENVYAARFVAEAGRGVLLGDPFEAAFQVREAGHGSEEDDVRRIRDWRTQVRGKSLQILRGDTHRHTEFSLDLRGVPDGSVLDFYRYMLDAASMDFGLISDHQYGADREYWWWLEEKLADLFHSPTGYIPLFGYERSVSFPNGHRNVVRSRRGIRALPFFQQVTDAFRRHNAVWGDLLAQDTRLLYEHVRKTGGVTIPHTSATNMGTDWRDHDPEVETLVEIFQGDRHSYEAAGTPLSDQKDLWEEDQPPAIRSEGYVANAWRKGYRLGVIASSDHVSTHISYAMVWTEERSREGILEAMKSRRTYAATDNIILEFRIGEHFMGEEFTASEVDPLRIRAVGTRPFSEIEILRNTHSIYRQELKSREVDLTYQDLTPEADVNYYYVRVRQEDGQTAWSSPIWVNLVP